MGEASINHVDMARRATTAGKDVEGGQGVQREMCGIIAEMKHVTQLPFLE